MGQEEGSASQQEVEVIEVVALPSPSAASPPVLPRMPPKVVAAAAAAAPENVGTTAPAAKRRRVPSAEAIDEETERARLAYVFQSMKSADAFARIQSNLTSSQGLRALFTLFPPSDFPMPGAGLKTCLRCGKMYDPVREADGCRMEHPDDFLVRIGKDTWEYQCRKCDEYWEEYHSDSEMARYDLGTDNPKGWCYEGPHEPDDQAKVDAEGWSEWK